jgi:hypothetical protein
MFTDDFNSSTPLPPITRLERDSQTRRCARLRRSILSALTLGIPPHIGACKSLRNLTQEVDLEKYYDIYDIQREDMGNMDVGINKDDFEDMESLKALKSLLHRLHTIRRILLCCFLAVDADGAHPDYNKWRVVVEQLQALGKLMGELGAELKRILSEEQGPYNNFDSDLTYKQPTYTSTPAYKVHIKNYAQTS